MTGQSDALLYQGLWCHSYGTEVAYLDIYLGRETVLDIVPYVEDVFSALISEPDLHENYQVVLSL